MRKRARIEIVSSVGNTLSIYVNDMRVAGQKPYAGGVVLMTWIIEAGDMRTALREPFCRAAGECPVCGGEGRIYIDDAEGIEPFVNCPRCARAKEAR